MKTLICVLFLWPLLASLNVFALTEEEYSEKLLTAMDERQPAKRLELLETLAAQGDEYTLFTILNNLAKTAYQAGDLRASEEYSKDLLRLSEKYSDDWNYGNAIHDGNMVLGLNAVANRDLQLASEFLIKAGSTPGSPQLNSFGPNMTLASVLIENGETSAVIRYFDLVGEFWQLERGRLDNWSASAQDGRVPNFGTNLHY